MLLEIGARRVQEARITTSDTTKPPEQKMQIYCIRRKQLVHKTGIKVNIFIKEEKICTYNFAYINKKHYDQLGFLVFVHELFNI